MEHAITRILPACSVLDLEETPLIPRPHQCYMKPLSTWSHQSNETWYMVKTILMPQAHLQLPLGGTNAVDILKFSWIPNCTLVFEPPLLVASIFCLLPPLSSATHGRDWLILVHMDPIGSFFGFKSECKCADLMQFENYRLQLMFLSALLQVHWACTRVSYKCRIHVISKSIFNTPQFGWYNFHPIFCRSCFNQDLYLDQVSAPISCAPQQLMTYHPFLTHLPIHCHSLGRQNKPEEFVGHNAVGSHDCASTSTWLPSSPAPRRKIRNANVAHLCRARSLTRWNPTGGWHLNNRHKSSEKKIWFADDLFEHLADH